MANQGQLQSLLSDAALLIKDYAHEIKHQSEELTKTSSKESTIWIIDLEELQGLAHAK